MEGGEGEEGAAEGGAAGAGTEEAACVDVEASSAGEEEASGGRVDVDLVVAGRAGN